MRPSDFSVSLPPSLPVCRDVPVLSLERRTSPDTGENGIFTLRLCSPGWKTWNPGQFVMIRPQKTTRPDIYWARPFSIARADGEELRIEFQAAGRGTRNMLALERGEPVTVWGPLGNAFAVSPAYPTLLLAGGIGIAPFVGYIERHPAPGTLRLEFGHRLPIGCYPFAECLNRAGVTARSHRERGPDDLKKFINTLERGISETAGKNGLVLACGPMPFLRSVQTFALRCGARAQLSLETRMACGVGACLGCVVKTPVREPAPGTPPEFRFVQTCTNGPVFRADQLDLENA